MNSLLKRQRLGTDGSWLSITEEEGQFWEARSLVSHLRHVFDRVTIVMLSVVSVSSGHCSDPYYGEMSGCLGSAFRTKELVPLGQVLGRMTLACHIRVVTRKNRRKGGIRKQLWCTGMKAFCGFTPGKGQASAAPARVFFLQTNSESSRERMVSQRSSVLDSAIRSRSGVGFAKPFLFILPGNCFP